MNTLAGYRGYTVKDKYETVYVFDCGDPSRLGKYESIVKDSKNIIVVDHHIDPKFGTLQFIDSEAASTTQVLYRELIKEGIRHNFTVVKPNPLKIKNKFLSIFIDFSIKSGFPASTNYPTGLKCTSKTNQNAI